MCLLTEKVELRLSFTFIGKILNTFDVFLKFYNVSNCNS